MGNPEEPAYQQHEGKCRQCGKKYTYYDSVKRHPDHDICDDCEKKKIEVEMTIDEAIKILNEEPVTCEFGRKVVLEYALKLGIEALDQLKRERAKKVGFWRDKLPSETEE